MLTLGGHKGCIGNCSRMRPILCGTLNTPLHAVKCRQYAALQRSMANARIHVAVYLGWLSKALAAEAQSNGNRFQHG